jgi:hypothetical protein
MTWEPGRKCRFGNKGAGFTVKSYIDGKLLDSKYEEIN